MKIDVLNDLLEIGVINKSNLENIISELSNNSLEKIVYDESYKNTEDISNRCYFTDNCGVISPFSSLLLKIHLTNGIIFSMYKKHSTLNISDVGIGGDIRFMDVENTLENILYSNISINFSPISYYTTNNSVQF